MTVLVTGAAGFIGFNVARALLARGESVIGLDSVNAYYDVRLKEARLRLLQEQRGFSFERLDLADREGMAAMFARHRQIDRVVHLAAQAGVRHSLTHPESYIDANIVGQLSILEGCRRLDRLRHLVYASSSSVYGANTKMPFSVSDPVDRPVSLYAATKRADELMGVAYAHLFGMPMTGLRFFTVYGPWGRPDMAAYIFVRSIYAGEPIRLFNGGDLRRDFTFIDDIVQGVIAALDHPPAASTASDGTTRPPHRIYNLGNSSSEPLMRFVSLIEEACGRKAVLELAPMQPGDVLETFADIEASQRDLGFAPRVGIDEGIPRFVDWYKEYHGV